MYRFLGFVTDNDAQCTWHDDINSYRGMIKFVCPDDTIITGFRSRHNDDKEDRIWDVKCCQVNYQGFLQYARTWWCKGVANRAWFGPKSRNHPKKHHWVDLKILSWKVSFCGFKESQERILQLDHFCSHWSIKLPMKFFAPIMRYRYEIRRKYVASNS